MANIISTTDRGIIHNWHICRNLLQKHGFNPKFPANTHPKKTYLWKNLVKLSDLFIELDFSDQDKQLYVDISMKHMGWKVKKYGLSVLTHKDVIEHCLAKLGSILQKQNSGLMLISDTYNFLLSKSSDENFLNLLLTSSPKSEYRYIVHWMLSDRLSLDYVSLSKSCLYALNNLELADPYQRSFVPTLPAINQKRHELMVDKRFVHAVKQIMKNDWRIL